MRVVWLISALLAAPALAVERIAVLGLFKDMAVVKIDGHTRKLRLGQESPEGVRLLRADATSVLLWIDGREQEFRLGQDVHGQFSAPSRQKVQIARGIDGMYQSVGSINGQTVNFLVDTGATSVAMNEATARRLGLDYRVEGRPMAVGTASGTARAWRVVLERVKLGGIELRQVEAAVVAGPGPGDDVLLGMSFLGRLYLKDTGQLLELEPKL
ncbi:MAG: TIGR02281 family clan AA aspartic protease [Gammaproteobacteria bacterium]|nr:TIGR02281 family clan AA aspartic protease [Gammaproteobacteria bacterium]